MEIKVGQIWYREDFCTYYEIDTVREDSQTCCCTYYELDEDGEMDEPRVCCMTFREIRKMTLWSEKGVR